MMDNHVVLKRAFQKADMAISDMSDPKSGQLNPEQADKFMSIPIKKSKLIGMINVQGMSRNEKEIHKEQGLSGSVFARGTSNQAVNEAQRTKPNLLDRVKLTAKLARGAVKISDEILEDNIEGPAFQDLIRNRIAEAAKKDIERLIISGDTSNTSDEWLSTFNGLLTSVATNVHAAGGVNLDKDVLRDIDLSMDDEYREEQEKFVFMTCHKAATYYRDSLSNRQTALGDSALSTGYNASSYALYNGNPVMPIPLMPSDLGVGSNETVVVYGDPKWIVLGYQRDIRITPEMKPGDGCIIFHVTARFDMKLIHEPMFVKATGILVD